MDEAMEICGICQRCGKRISNADDVDDARQRLGLPPPSAPDLLSLAFDTTEEEQNERIARIL